MAIPPGKDVSLTKGGLLHIPVQVRREWGVDGRPATLYCFFEEKRLVVVTEDDLASELAERKKSPKRKVRRRGPR